VPIPPFAVDFPLDRADPLITALDLADPDRLARIPALGPGDDHLTAVLLACPAGHPPARLRLQAVIEGRRVYLGAVYELYQPFLGEVRAVLERRERQESSG
jgi:hypothetical protein